MGQGWDVGIIWAGAMGDAFALRRVVQELCRADLSAGAAASIHTWASSPQSPIAASTECANEIAPQLLTRPSRTESPGCLLRALVMCSIECNFTATQPEAIATELFSLDQV